MAPESMMTAAALWLRAWIHGEASGDDVLDALVACSPDAPAVVTIDADAPAPLIAMLAVASSADAAWLLLPRPGSTIGWPRSLRGAPEPSILLSSGLRSTGLVRLGGSGWRVDRTSEVAVATVSGQALGSRAGARALDAILARGAERLGRLGLDRAPSRHPGSSWMLAARHLPPSTDPGLLHLIQRAGSIMDALDAALADDGAAVTAGEAAARERELREVRAGLTDLVVALVGGAAVA